MDATAGPWGRDYVAIAKAYARGAAADRRGKWHCKWVRLAAKRHLDDLRRERRKSYPYYFDAESACDPCDFIEKLPHVEGNWDEPTIRLEPWQIFVVVAVFGWRRKVDGRRRDGGRRFNTVYIECAKKNAKSTLSAGIALYCETCEGERGPQVLCAATTGGQARIVFDIARRMVAVTPDLRAAFDLEARANAVPCWSNGGTLKPINAKSASQEGVNPHCRVVDELHVHQNRALFDVLKTAAGGRANPLGWYITTAGFDLEGVCFEQRTMVTKILEGVLEAEHYFGIIFTLDEGDDPYDEQAWIKPNPNLGVSVKLDTLREDAAEARVMPGSEGAFKTKRLNLWLRAAQAWLSLERWNACADLGLDESDFSDWDAWVGADLADRDDVASIALVVRRDAVTAAFARHYLPRELVEEKARTVGTHYETWAKSGHLILTDGDWIDHRVIEDDIRTWCKRFEVGKVIFDQYGGATTMASRLVDDGINAAILAKNAKNYSEPAKEMEALIKVGRFRHTGDPVLTWMASNVVVDRRVDGSILPKKASAKSPHKIDGIDAVIMALSGTMAGEDEGPRSYLESHEPLVL